MDMKRLTGFYIGLLAVAFCSCEEPVTEIKPKPTPEPAPEQRDSVALDTVNIERAVMEWNAVVEHYWRESDHLLYAAYPHVNGDAAVWGYGSFLSAYNTLYQHLPETAFGFVPDYATFRQEYEDAIWNGLEKHWVNYNGVNGYGVYPGNTERYYDDNVWIGIDLIELYEQTKNERYLNRAKDVWKFIMTGLDDKFGGGVYWKEEFGSQSPSKNTCSNAPVAVFGMKLYNATQDETYRTTAAQIYTWTKNTLQDPEDKMYWDNIKEEWNEETQRMEQVIEEWKFPYNVGQMLQASVLLYNSYKEEEGGDIYLQYAMELAQAAYNFYFTVEGLVYNGSSFKMLQVEDLWFYGIMFRGYAELYNAELDETNRALADGYIEDFKKVLDYAWVNARDPQTHLIGKDLSGRTKDEIEVNGEKVEAIDLRYPSAITEMYARIATLN